MSQSNASSKVRCPFYFFHRLREIHCEGHMAGCTLVSQFGRLADMKEQMESVCHLPHGDGGEIRRGRSMQGMTRRRALEHCLTLLEAQARCFSTNFSLLCAREGYEQAQGETVEAMERVREMMREEREREEAAARELAEKRKEP